MAFLKKNQGSAPFKTSSGRHMVRRHGWAQAVEMSSGNVWLLNFFFQGWFLLENHIFDWYPLLMTNIAMV